MHISYLVEMEPGFRTCDMSVVRQDCQQWWCRTECDITGGVRDMNTGGTKVIKGVLDGSCIKDDLQNSTKTFLLGSKATDSKFFPTRTLTGPLFQSSGISSDLK